MEQRWDLVGEVENINPSTIIIPCTSMPLYAFERIKHVGTFIFFIPFYYTSSVIQHELSRHYYAKVCPFM